MSYQSDIKTAFTAASTITALVGTRVYSDIAPGDAAAPFIVFQTIATTGTTTHDGERNLEFPLIQFSCWAKTKAAAIALASAVNTLLDGNTIAGSSGITFRFSGQNSSYDTESRLFGEMIDFDGACAKN